MSTDRVTASVDVAVDPETAFRIFTEEVDSWWLRGPANFYDGGRASAMRFEPGLGGRYLEIYDEAAGDVLEIGRITVWEPGRRFVWRSSLDDTETEVTFEAGGSGTRVTVEQRLVAGGTKAHFLSGWPNILGWFGRRADHPAPRPAGPKDLPRLNPVLHYRNVAEAREWLVRVFGFQLRNQRGYGDYDEVALGDSVLMLEKSGENVTGNGGHSLYAYVDDLPAHLEQARAGGAKIIEEIKRYGDRHYIAEDLDGHRWTFAQARPTQR